MTPRAAAASLLADDDRVHDTAEPAPRLVAPAPAGDRAPGLPAHIGIIMDGNGRWAEQRRLPRREGHRRGVEALRRCVRQVGHRGVKHLTLFAFSSENWKRPVAEVRDLMALLRFFVERDLAELKANGVHVRVLGERDSLAPDIRGLLERAETVTRDESKMVLNIAFNYGGRDEIVRAARRLAEAAAAGTLDPSAISQELFSQTLDTAGFPDPDLIIRTSGEQRLSNFLLWQAAYAEFVFTPTLWPDFDEAALDEALSSFAERTRRFGGRLAQTPGAVQAAALG